VAKRKKEVGKDDDVSPGAKRLRHSGPDLQRYGIIISNTIILLPGIGVTLLLH
jgi:hypothetical protein